MEEPTLAMFSGLDSGSEEVKNDHYDFRILPALPLHPSMLTRRDMIKAFSLALMI